jgi:hypothetical protein
MAKQYDGDGRFERDIPTGDPESVFCRWCNTGRVLSKGRTKGLICVACDTNTVSPCR